MALTMIDEASAPEVARSLLIRSLQEGQSQEASRAIMEMVTTIMVYKFTTLSRREIEAMLGITLQETRVYREAKAEGERSLILRQLTASHRRITRKPQSGNYNALC